MWLWILMLVLRLASAIWILRLHYWEHVRIASQHANQNAFYRCDSEVDILVAYRMQIRTDVTSKWEFHPSGTHSFPQKYYEMIGAQIVDYGIGWWQYARHNWPSRFHDQLTTHRGKAKTAWTNPARCRWSIWHHTRFIGLGIRESLTMPRNLRHSCTFCAGIVSRQKIATNIVKGRHRTANYT